MTTNSSVDLIDDSYLTSKVTNMRNFDLRSVWISFQPGKFDSVNFDLRSVWHSFQPGKFDSVNFDLRSVWNSFQLGKFDSVNFDLRSVWNSFQLGKFDSVNFDLRSVWNSFQLGKFDSVNFDLIRSSENNTINKLAPISIYNFGLYYFNWFTKYKNLKCYKAALNEEFESIASKNWISRYETYACQHLYSFEALYAFEACLFCTVLMYLFMYKKVQNSDNNFWDWLYISTKITDYAECLASMLNIKEDRALTALSSSTNMSEKFDWLFKDFFKSSPNTVTVYPAFNNSILDRLVSYSRVSHQEKLNCVSFSKLADAGFKVEGEGLQVKCQDCGILANIESFELSPSDVSYHKLGCSFVRSQDHNLQVDVDSSSAASNLDASSVQRNEEDMLYKEVTNEKTRITEIQTTLFSAKNFDEGFQNDLDDDSVFPTIIVDVPNYEPSLDTNYERMSQQTQPGLSAEIQSIQTLNEHFDHKNPLMFNTAFVDSSNTLTVPEQTGRSRSPTRAHLQSNFSASSLSGETRAPASQFIRQQSDSSASSGYVSDTEAEVAPASQLIRQQSDSIASSGYVSDTEAEVDDSELFQMEQENAYQEAPLSSNSCTKNPGHFSYFPLWQFKLNDIPSNVRHPSVLKFFQRISEITVRLVSTKISRNRPKSNLINGEAKFRFGTGIAVSDPDECYHIPNVENNECPRKWNTVKKYLHLTKSTGSIFIETNRNFVYDDTEAQSTRVEFFYDNPNRKGVVIAKGVSVHHSFVSGDHKSILVCKTFDVSLVNMVKESRKEIQTLAQNFPRMIKESMMRRVFLISHPHGCEKVFSYGEYVIVKYALQRETVNDQVTTKMVKLNNHSQISQKTEDVRKILLYTADTCNGSTGAAVVCFKKTGSGATEDIVLDMWMHNGADKKHGLSGSLMKVLTSEDVANHETATTFRSLVQENINAESDQTANQVVNCPMFTVYAPASHPVYASYIKRLYSFPITFIHVHTARDLADGGFFYAGYGDCVRCFQCALGLKSWRAGDIIHEEHFRNRPDCQFLLMKLRETGIDASALMSRLRQSNEQNTAQSQITSSSEIRNPEIPQRGTEEPKPVMVVQKLTVTPQSGYVEDNTNLTKVLELSTMFVPNPSQQEITVGMVYQSSFQNGEHLNAHKISTETILEREQQYLKQILICKVCFKNPVKDLFLPCGELFACTDCSKLLTHCPSCNKKIAATVTTYFS